MLGGSMLARLTQALGQIRGGQNVGETSVKLEPEIQAETQTSNNVKTAAFFSDVGSRGLRPRRQAAPPHRVHPETSVDGGPKPRWGGQV